MKPDDALDIVPKLSKIYDEPFGDSSQIPTTLICEVARKHVKVALTGDAGDEIFCGYNRYIWVKQIWKMLKNFPISLRKLVSHSLLKFPEDKWETIFLVLKNLLLNRYFISRPGEKFIKLLQVLDSKKFLG